MKLHSVFIHCQWCKLTCSRQYKQIHKAILSSTTNANRCTCRTFLHIKKEETPFFMWKNTGSHCRCLLYRRLKMACNVGHKYILYSYLLTKYHNDCIGCDQKRIVAILRIPKQCFCSTKSFLYYQKHMQTSINNEMFSIFDSLTQFPIWFIQMLNSPQFNVHVQSLKIPIIFHGF